jgi:hypothetical protein
VATAISFFNVQIFIRRDIASLLATERSGAGGATNIGDGAFSFLIPKFAGGPLASVAIRKSPQPLLIQIFKRIS